MRFTFVTLFPHLIKPYFSDSILSRAIKEQKIEIDFINPREFSQSKHSKVDAPKVGGGAGMLLDAVTLSSTLDSIGSTKSHIVVPQPSAKRFDNNDAKRLSTQSHIIFVCGRYEGIDERFIEVYADELFSLGDFVLTGGEIASIAFCDAISRHVVGVLGNESSLDEESFEHGLLEAPSFTKPDLFLQKKIPASFYSGNHKKIAILKHKMAIAKTKFHRPDLFIKNKATFR
jgi:tRNA (guanine37-N1)-methyltransferase